MTRPREYRSLYDVQRLLKEFNVDVYVGIRLCDVELFAMDLDSFYKAGGVYKST